MKNSTLVILIGIYCFLAFPFLGKSPLIWYDEGLLGEISWHFVEHDTFAQPLWTGYLGFETFSTHPNYLYFLLLAFSFKIFGVGILQARLVSAFAGLFLVVIFYFFTKKIYGAKLATISTLLLVFNPLFILSARIVRYEIVVALFTFASLSCAILAFRERKNSFFLLSGFFAALTILTHFNGILISFAVLVLILINRKHWKGATYFLIGLLATMTPYLIFIFIKRSIFIEQFFSLVSYRLPFSFSNLISNILREPLRWTKGVTTPLSLVLGVISFVFCLPEFRRLKNIYVPLIVLILGFAVSDYYKYYGYLAILLPLFCLLSGFFFTKYAQKDKRALFALFLLAGVLIIYLGVIEFKIVRDHNSDYGKYCERVKSVIKPQNVVLGDAFFWFCFPDGNLRGIVEQTWIHKTTGKSFSDIFEMQKIKYVILDPGKKTVFDTYLKGQLFPIPKDYSETIYQKCKQIGTVSDAFYTQADKGINTTFIYECRY